MLSDDYSPFGKYSQQIFILSLVIALPGIPIAVLGWLVFDNSYMIAGGLAEVVLGFVFLELGMRKQSKELFGPHQRWKDGTPWDTRNKDWRDNI